MIMGAMRMGGMTEKRETERHPTTDPSRREDLFPLTYSLILIFPLVFIY